MKTEVVELEFSDSLTSLIERIRESETVRVILVDQKSNNFLQDELTLRLLFRAAVNSGKQICIVTDKLGLKQLCHELNFPVFDNLKQVESIEWVVDESPRFEIKPKTTISSDSREISFDRIKNSQTNPSKLSTIYFIMSIFVIAVMVVIFFPSIRIHVSGDEFKRTEIIPVRVIPEYSGEGTLSTIPGETRSITVDVVETIPIYSLEEIPTTAASGEVVIQNLTNTSVIYPAHTEIKVINDPSKRYITQAEARLDGLTGSSVRVSVLAKDPGESGNLAPGSPLELITTEPGIVSVQNPQAITGGGSDLSITATLEDRNKIRSQVLEKAREEAIRLFVPSGQTEEYLILESVGIKSVVDETYTPEINFPGDALSLEMKVEFEGIVIRKSDINQYIAALERNIDPAAKNGILRSYQIEKTSTKRFNPDHTIDLDLIAEITRSKELDLENLLYPMDSILVDHVVASISSRINVEKVTVEKSPEWWPWIPLLPSRIAIEQN